MRVTVVGMGRVGLTTAIALEHLGHEVAAVDRDKRLVGTLRRGELPFHEPGLAPLWRNTRIAPVTELSPQHLRADILLIAVGTPGLPDGPADVSAVEGAARETGQLAPQGAAVVVPTNSTCPPGPPTPVPQPTPTPPTQRSVAPPPPLPLHPP